MEEYKFDTKIHGYSQPSVHCILNLSRVAEQKIIVYQDTANTNQEIDIIFKGLSFEKRTEQRNKSERIYKEKPTTKNYQPS